MESPQLRLNWEPVSLTPLEQVEARFSLYLSGKKDGVSILGNGTLLFIRGGDNDEDRARAGLAEAAFLTGFEVDELKEGGYLTVFHPAVAVFVGEAEFESVRSEVMRRIADLTFPSETFFGQQGDKFLVGLYARGKLQRDVHNFSFYKRLHPPLGDSHG